MHKRLSGREKLHAKIEHLSDNQIDQILSYVKSIEKTRLESGDPVDDELLAMLSAEVENRRARQVFEWESIRRRAEARTTGFSRTV